MSGILAKKVEMTRIIKNGAFVPVTLLRVPAITVFQVKTVERDGYDAVVLEFQEHTRPTRREVSRTGSLENVSVGDTVTLEMLEEGMLVSMVSSSKGQGFTGAVKRWNFKGAPAGHGHKLPRSLGSIGTRKPRRTKPGKKMHGHSGDARITLHKVPVELINKEHNIIAVRGPVPGARNSLVILDF